MILCNHTCVPLEKNICCVNCPKRDSCNDVCGDIPAQCGDAIYEQENTSLEVFKSKALSIMQSIAELDKQKKALEAQDAEVRKQLEAAMQQYGIKNFENDLLKIVYVEPTTRETFDTKKFKADCPEVATKYIKTSPVKGSVRITVK